MGFEMIQIWGDPIKDGHFCFEISKSDEKHENEMLDQLYAEYLEERGI